MTNRRRKRRTYVPAHPLSDQLAAYRRRYGARERSTPRPLLPITDWGGLNVLRALRQNPFG